MIEPYRIKTCHLYSLKTVTLIFANQRNFQYQRIKKPTKFWKPCGFQPFFIWFIFAIASDNHAQFDSYEN